MQENKIEYIETDEIETEMDDMEDFEGLLNGEDSSISYVLGPVVAVKKLQVTLIILNSSNRLGLLKYVVRYMGFMGKNGTLTLGISSSFLQVILGQFSFISLFDVYFSCIPSSAWNNESCLSRWMETLHNVI